MKRNYDAGIRCGDDRYLPDHYDGAVGMVRISFAAMSSIADVDHFLDFVNNTFVNRDVADEYFDEAKSSLGDAPDVDASDSDHKEKLEEIQESSVLAKGRRKVLRLLRCC